ncbi:bacillithiol biosynthesis cysteine-adding enzyme BshC [Aureibaculum sp. 2210JD6-5]|uniref:bacillithiol biosynthesis cysteine-adding enzyme BshC n=1 Tax=Aureibaculum sp. 2210JD6-5 TaxID=3103957 RepID=UPI002AACFF2D|nr:bacillithiol biosynthesis cysteine-adding enzyme BshC [Aureibaculum sp. 2210JD6-5]MDY7394346.1 bacillithiol biosynthesis cysteine-adding enzyme BshC [Aureibaculum sp. 2210JD6-5]
MIEADCTTHIPFAKTGYFSTIICDYLNEDEKIKPFYSNFPNSEGFKKQIDAKRHSELVSESHRKILVTSLENQYQNIEVSDSTKQNIKLLKKENTFTVTTGHQLNLFTGPLYFLYKIISTINLCKQLKAEFPNENFVPVYWMATEDHDFEEINYFNFKGQKISWNIDCKGAVGRLQTEGLEQVANVFEKALDSSKNANYLIQLFKDSYLKHDNLTDATRYLTNELFSEYGLVIIDGDDKELKKQFIPFVEDELLNQTSFKKVSSTIEQLEKNYTIQVNPREINLFYLTNELRERIVYEDGVYRVVDNDISWSKNEILKELNDFPERFSPNVIMRPLYQEVILPNLCYIGGGGELAYWLELAAYFEAVKVPFPILLLRNSALIVTEKQKKKADRLNIAIDELFLDQHQLVNKKIKEILEIEIDFSEQRSFLKKQFEDLEQLAEKTDKSFIGAVKAQEVKQLKGLDNLEKRLLKAQKRKLNDEVERIKELQNQLFPNQSLEERQRNFSEMYLAYGERLVPSLVKSLRPLDGKFTILEL